MRTLALAFLAITASATTGCDTFSDQATVHSVTHTDFDDRFHDGLAEVWNTCTEPLDLTPGLTSISMLDGCGVQDTQTAEGDAVVFLLGAEDPIDLGGTIPSRLVNSHFVFSDVPWPMQNCEIDFHVIVDLHRLRLLNQETRWRTHDGKPSFYIDYDFPSRAHVVDATVSADVSCPSGLNERALQGTLDAILPVNGVAVRLTGLDLDIDVELDHTPSTLTGDLDARFHIGGVEVDTFIVNAANVLGISDTAFLAAIGLSTSDLEDMVEPLIESALVDLPEVVVDGLMAAVPSGHVICDVAIRGGDELRITSDAAGRLQCVEILPYR
ncbi:MAG: hypothetical protein KC549_09100 [Myxococcales bacterium]|nr:hypothetical protein [Myxococcales bacterium]MCB9546463.1 hypothetical protein [Myxococcales bacterium]